MKRALFSSLLSALSIAAVLAAAADAHAFCRTRSEPSAVDDCASKGPSLYWKNKCVGFTVAKSASKKADLSKARGLVNASFDQWLKGNSTCTPGVHALEQEPSAATKIGFNKVGVNENVIIFRDDSWPYDDAGNPLALTTVTFNADTGEILDADIEVNTADKAVTAAEPLPATGYDLESIITHEVGHFLGLAHTRVNGSTMESRYDRGDTGLRSIESDDQKGICAIYPSDNDRTTDLPGEATKTLVSGPCDPIINIPPPVDKEEPTCLCAHGPGTGGRGGAGSLAVVAVFCVAIARRRHPRQGRGGT